MKKMRVNNLIIISDTHFGCRLGLCPSEPIPLDNGGTYHSSPLQQKLGVFWEEFWYDWVPQVTKKEEFVLVHNGDVMDGVHHNSTTQISHNLSDQANIAEMVMRPILNHPLGCVAYYQIRGTVAHSGQSGAEEEKLAKSLKAKKDEYGHYSRYELWAKVGQGLCHIMHHIGTTSSANYESTAIHKELIDEFTEAGRWKGRPPDFVIRSHRHRHIETRIPAEIGDAVAIVTAGWQLKTPFVFTKAGGRIAPPQIGGIIIRQGDEDVFTRHKVWAMEREKVVII